MKKILIIGLGQLGLPVAKYIHEVGSTRGLEVYGYDIREEAMDYAWRSAGIFKANNFSDFDVYIICIATHRPGEIYLPQTSGVFAIADRISKDGKDGALVSIESTIPNGTSRKIAEMIGKRMHIVHAPHRWYVHEEKEHGVNQLRVIGGVDECCLYEGLKFYDGHEQKTSTSAETDSHQPRTNNESLGIPMYPVSHVELAELTKVIENAHRYLQIAFAEELFMYCAANKIDFQELRAALNTKWNVEILEPRDGIGGHCLPKDTRMFVESSHSARSKILSAAIEVDSNYRKYREMHGLSSSFRAINKKSLLSTASGSPSEIASSVSATT